MVFLCLGSLCLNFILYFLFGLLLTGGRGRRAKGKPGEECALPSPVMTVIAGFFLYYSLFTFFCVPIMYRWRPLSLLTCCWGIAMLVLSALSLLLNRRLLMPMGRRICQDLWSHRLFFAGLFVLLLAQIVIVLYSYQFTLDAAYYVANVTTSLQTNSLNIYDPYTGDWQDHFEMRYFFATYPMNDAVMCSLLGIPALMQVKLVMAAVVLLLTNALYYLIGRELFGEDRKKIFWTMLFAGVINFYFITIYTSSNFLVTRTYEGKSILGNVVLPAILLLYIRMLKVRENAKKMGTPPAGEGVLWGYLFLVCFGSTVLSSSSNMLVPAALAVIFFPMMLMEKDLKILPKMFLCMLPNLILMAAYVAYVKGMFVFYTYPR